MIDNQRKQEMLDNNMKVFGNVSIGIHGKELPKYHKSINEWWRTRINFNDNPKESSLLRLKQSKKYWAKEDYILLHDMLNTEPKNDDFKQIHVKKPRKNLVVDDPNKLNRIRKKDVLILGGSAQKQKKNYRWTNIENQFAQRDNRLTAEVDKARAERSDYDPLYSSFSPNGTFNPPPSSLDILKRQKEQLNKTSLTNTQTNKSIGGIRAATAGLPDSSLMGMGKNDSNLFTRVGTVDGSPVKAANRSFKNSAENGIRSGAFKGV